LNADKISPFAFANFSITKEIGDFASISFNAINFLNTMQLIKSTQTNLNSSLYATSYIPAFYYGLSLTLKL